MTTTLRYFAYGSNMLTRRMRVPERAPSASALGTGVLHRWRLACNKIGQDGSGKCTIAKTGDAADSVHGVIYEVDLADKSRLDVVEGLGIGYRECEAEIATSDGTMQSITYVANLTDELIQPFHWYVALVIAGAIEHQLPAEYIKMIRDMESTGDPDQARHAKHMRLLDAD